MATIVFCPDFLRLDRGVEIWLERLRLDEGTHLEVICWKGEIVRNKSIFYDFSFNPSSWFTTFLFKSFSYFGLKKLLRLSNVADFHYFLLAVIALPLLFFKKRKFNSIVICGPVIVHFMFRLFFKSYFKFIYVGHAGYSPSIGRYSDLFVALTPEMGRYASKFTENVVVIPNGVDVNLFYSVNVDRCQSRVLSVSALTDDKNIFGLINSFSFLPGISLDIYGRGYLFDIIADMEQAKAGQVSISSISNDQIHLLYRKYKVFVLASMDEAFGLVFLEAYASGCILVAHDCENLRSFLPPDTVFCDANNPSSLANAIEQAFLLFDAGTRSVDMDYLAGFDWGIVSNEYRNLFSKFN